MAASHNQQVREADVLNAYKIVSNRKFGDNDGKSTTIVRAMNSLMSAGALYNAHLAQYMWELEY